LDVYPINLFLTLTERHKPSVYSHVNYSFRILHSVLKSRAGGWIEVSAQEIKKNPIAEIDL
jgi:hypothetical protein